MRSTILLSLCVLAACSSAADFTTAAYDRRSGQTLWRLDEQPRGFVVSVRQNQRRFVPYEGTVEQSCRREATVLALMEARKRGISDSALDERLVRSSVGQNGLTGVTSCTAQATVQS